MMCFRYFVVCCGALMSVCAAAQSQRDEAMHLLEEVRKSYLDTPSFEACISVEYFETYTAHKPRETSEILIYKDGNKCYKKFMQTEEILNDEVYIVVDHQAQVLTYSEANSQTLEEILGIHFSFLIDSAEVVELTKNEGLAIITLEFSNQLISKMVMTVDIQKSLIKAQDTYYSAPYANVVFGSSELPRIRTFLIKLDPQVEVDDRFFTPDRLKEEHGNVFGNYLLLNAAQNGL